MKNKILSIVASALVFASLSTTAFASTTVKNTNKIGDVMTEEQEKISANFLEKHPDLVSKYNKLKNAKIQEADSSMHIESPAAPLTDYYTYFVAYNYDSSDETISNYEIVTDEITTENDFNGTIYVGTVEIGYGTEYANFNGDNLSKYDIVLLDFDGDNIIDGFIDVWKIDNVTSGKFSSNATSTNYNPNHTAPFYTGINIQ